MVIEGVVRGPIAGHSEPLPIPGHGRQGDSCAGGGEIHAQVAGGLALPSRVGAAGGGRVEGEGADHGFGRA